MSDHERNDGLVIGIMVVLVILVLGGLGLFGLSYVRMSRSVEMERMAAEQARLEAMRQLDAAEAEARQRMSEDQTKEVEPNTKPVDAEPREKQP